MAGATSPHSPHPRIMNNELILIAKRWASVASARTIASLKQGSGHGIPQYCLTTDWEGNIVAHGLLAIPLYIRYTQSIKAIWKKKK